jgi:hypothetical protein
VLSAYLAFCDDVVYAPYRGASQASYASALQDQQVAGALMWVFITFAYLLPAVVITLQILSPRGRRDPEHASGTPLLQAGRVSQGTARRTSDRLRFAHGTLFAQCISLLPPPFRTRRSEEQAHALRVDTRWPVVFAVLAVALLLTMMPDRVRVLPVWTPGVLGIVLIMPMAAVMLSREKERWLPIERTITLVFCVAVGAE